jgi:hypothetical protein
MQGRRGFRATEDLDDPSGSASDPSQRDVPVLRSSRPVPPVLDDLGPLSLDLDVLPHSLDLDAQPHAAGLDAPLEQEEGDFMGAVSDLELTIDDLRAASDLDLESFVDSTRTVSNLVDEPLSRHESSTDRAFSPATPPSSGPSPPGYGTRRWQALGRVPLRSR